MLFEKNESILCRSEKCLDLHDAKPTEGFPGSDAGSYEVTWDLRG